MNRQFFNSAEQSLLSGPRSSGFENGPNRLGRGVPGRNGFGPRSPEPSIVNAVIIRKCLEIRARTSDTESRDT